MQRTQHLALALTGQGYRCVYVNPHLGREFPHPLGGQQCRAKALAKDLIELHVHLRREPVFHARRLTASEAGQVTSCIEDLLLQLEASLITVIVSLPVWIDIAISLRNSRRAQIVYDCHDYLPGLGGIAQEIVALEPQLFSVSQIVICTSNRLIERARECMSERGEPVLLRNATAAGLLRLRRLSFQPKQPVVGYIGALDLWFDTASIEVAAAMRPEWRFELVGRVEAPHIVALKRFANVHFAGEVAFEDLGSYLTRFSAGIIPFIINPLIEATDPIKVYEYFAAGVPVVASCLPELDRFGTLLRRYVNPIDFVAQLEAALREDSPELAIARRAAVVAETWENRGEALARIIAP